MRASDRAEPQRPCDFQTERDLLPPGEMMRRWAASRAEHKAYIDAEAGKPRDKQLPFHIWKQRAGL